MWVTAWLLVGLMNLQQVAFPPFYSQEDCEAVRAQYGRKNLANSTQCIQVKVFANVQK